MFTIGQNIQEKNDDDHFDSSGITLLAGYADTNMHCAYHKLKCCHLLTQAVLEVHDNSASEVADEASVIERLGGGAGNEIPTVDPHHDWHRAPQRGAEVHIHWYKDVEVQAVFTDLLGMKYKEVFVYKYSKKITHYHPEPFFVARKKKV